MEPEEIVKYFESKGLKTSYNWREVYEEAHAKSFTVAKMMNADLLNDTHDMLTTAIKEGWNAGHFQKEAEQLFKKKGWDGVREVKNPKTGEVETVELGTPRRIKNIFQNNINSAYAVGRYKQQLEDVDIAPYFQYMCILDEATRPEHRAMHGKVFRYDDHFWTIFYPPNGWGCRCFVRSLSASEVKKLGITVEKSNISPSPRGEGWGEGSTSYSFKLGTKDYTLRADEGWSTNMGTHAWNIDVLAYSKIEKLPQELKDTFISQMAQNPHNKSRYVEWATNILNNGSKNVSLEKTLTWLPPELLKHLSRDNIRLKSPIVVINDKQVGHSGKNKNIKQALSHTEYLQVYDIVNKPDEIYYDYTRPEQEQIAFIRKIPDSEKCIKVCIRLSQKSRIKSNSNLINNVTTVGKVPYIDMQRGNKYKKIE